MPWANKYSHFGKNSKLCKVDFWKFLIGASFCGKMWYFLFSQKYQGLGAQDFFAESFGTLNSYFVTVNALLLVFV